LLIVSNSDLNSLPKVFVDAPEYLKYSRIESLFFSKAFVKDSVVVFTVRISAENLPVAFMLFIKFCCRLLATALADAPPFAIVV
jgi:hypothetical protein